MGQYRPGARHGRTPSPLPPPLAATNYVRSGDSPADEKLDTLQTAWNTQQASSDAAAVRAKHRGQVMTKPPRHSTSQQA
jgi:hypothetical protein